MITDVRLSTPDWERSHLMHRPLRPLAAQPATVTVAAAYEGAVTKTLMLNRAASCVNEGVRFGAYNARVTTTPTPASPSSALSVPAAHAGSRRAAEGVAR